MESIYMTSFPAWASNATKTAQIAGFLPDGYEVHQLEVVPEFTQKSSASAFAIAAADQNTIAAAFFTKVRGTAWGIGDAINLTTPEARALCIAATGRDSFTEDPNQRAAHSVPASGGTAENSQLPIRLNFIHRGLDYPEVWCPSSDQLNIAGCKLDVDTATSTLSSTVLTNGTLNISMSDMKVYGVVVPAPLIHGGPAHFMRSRSVVTSQDVEPGRGLDVFLAFETDPATVETNASQITIIRDGTRSSPRNVRPTRLAQEFGATQFPQDGNLPVDLTNNSLGGTGIKVTPLVWIAGHVRATEWQWPTYSTSRVIYQNLASGGSASQTLLYWQVRPIDEVAPQLTQLVNKYGVQVPSLDALPVRGGGGKDNDWNKLFKGRYISATPPAGS